MPRQLSKEELAIIEATRREGEELARKQANPRSVRPTGALLKSALFYLLAILLLAVLFSLIYTLGERMTR